MHKVIEVIKKIRTKSKSPIFVDVEKYLETGEKKAFSPITTSGNWDYYNNWYTYNRDLFAVFSLEDISDEIQMRLLDVFAKCDDWIGPMHAALANEKPSEDHFSLLLKAVRKCKMSESVLAANFWGSRIEPTNIEKKPNSGARYYLALSDEELRNLIKSIPQGDEMPKLAPFLLEFAPKRLDAILEDLIYQDTTQPKSKNQRFFYPEEYFFLDSVKIILEKTGKQYAQRIFDVWSQMKIPSAKCDAGFNLIRLDPDLYREPMRRFILERIAANEFFDWKEIITEYGLEHVDLVCRSFESDWKNVHYRQSYFVAETLDVAVKKFASKAFPLIEATLKNPDSGVRFIGLETLVKLDDRQFDDLAQQRFVEEFASGKEALDLLRLARRWKPERLVEEFWKLLGNKSKPVRETASRILGEIGEIDLDRVAKLLVDKKADNRDSAVNILAQQKTDQSIKLLESRLDEEENDDIRDKILTALESAWEAKGKKITMKTIEQRIDRAAAKIEKFEIQWLKFDKLPPLQVGKKKLDEKIVRYLLYRQSRCKEMRADIEAKPLFAMLDRESSGDFALFVLNAFLNSKMDAADRWALAVAGLLGDDRIVPILSKQIQIWADAARGKMSEYAVQSLALLGTETALTVVNSMTIRYRTKYKNIGTAAAAAFELVAEQRGVTADELGDRVVPMLGFEPGKPKVWNIGGKNFDVRIGMDFKVSIYDTEKKKAVASLPKTAPKEITEELKELKDALKEVVKGQLLRIENMLVRQYRWPIERWTELYQRHPVLRPFTVRLVWGIYDEKGKLKTTFRALEDGSLTDAEDSTITLPKTGKIGIVHPLELTEEQRNAWRGHLLDFEIVQPFPQMERSVVVATDEEKTQTVSTKWFGMQLNAMTFKNRSEKLGWRRGSVCDGGWIPAYWKSFPEAGADVFLGLDNFYIGIGVEEEVTLQNLYFVKTGSVEIGSYVYDDPDTDKGDERIIPFGKVPPIVFSEAIGDMQKIAPDQKENV